MATTTYDIENAKILRASPNIGIRIICENQIIFTFTKEDIISVSLSLRGVETKFTEPDLQASTIEIKIYYNGDKEDFLQFRGKQTVIQYKSSYSDNVWSNDSPTQTTSNSSQCVGIRAFYCTFDQDSLQIEQDHIVTIKGTDKVGTVTGDSWALYLWPSFPSYLHNNRSYYKLEDIINAYVDELNKEFDAYKYGTAPQAWLNNSSPYYERTYYMPEMSKRKKLAQFVNYFRGTHPTDDSTIKSIYKRFVFRDAGAPLMMWVPYVITPSVTSNRFYMIRQANIANDIYNDVWTNYRWELGYEDVSDLIVEYGNVVKEVDIDNLYAGRSTEYVDKEYELVSNMSVIITTDKPSVSRGYAASYHISGQSPTITLSQLNPTTFALHCTSFDGTGTITVHFSELRTFYNGSSGAGGYITGMTSGDVIKTGPFYGLKSFEGLTTSDVEMRTLYLRNSIARAFRYCGLTQPQWITFKWRGHPGMQPRDLILFTEKDGTQNYYEIESLTLDHENGGLISTVKAMYKCAY